MSATSKLEKEKLKLIQEKCQGLLNEMLRDEDNKYCVDCDAKGPRWASWNLGIFLCIRCAGIHRNLGVHISRVKSVNLDTWTPEQVVTMQHMGNSRARAVYEANMPDNFRRPQTDVALENFIRAKYEHKKYIAQEFIPPTIPKINWDSEIEESLRKKKEAKKQGTTDIGPLIPKPKPVSSSSSTSTSGSGLKILSSNAQPSSKSSTNSAATNVELNMNGKNKNPSDDLLGLMTNDCDTLQQSNSNLLSDPFASPIKTTTTNNGSTPNANNVNSNADDLGSIFTTPTDGSSSASGQKMTKESILSLYGQASTTPNVTMNPFTSPQQPTTMFQTPNPGNPFPQFMSPQLQQQQPQQSTFNQFNTGGLLGSTTDNSMGGMNNLFNFQSDATQIQQQMHGLSFNNVPLTNSAMNMGNYSQIGQTGIQPFLGTNNTSNSSPFQSQPQQLTQQNPSRPFF